jgi:hypothetical protein
MKFEEFLEAHMVPEWSNKYIAYGVSHACIRAFSHSIQHLSGAQELKGLLEDIERAFTKPPVDDPLDPYPEETHAQWAAQRQEIANSPVDRRFVEALRWNLNKIDEFMRGPFPSTKRHRSDRLAVTIS